MESTTVGRRGTWQGRIHGLGASVICLPLPVYRREKWGGDEDMFGCRKPVAVNPFWGLAFEFSFLGANSFKPREHCRASGFTLWFLFVVAQMRRRTGLVLMVQVMIVLISGVDCNYLVTNV